MARVGLFILITLATFSHANSNNIEDQNSVLTLHADNAFLTERVNLDNKPSYQSAIIYTQDIGGVFSLPLFLLLGLIFSSDSETEIKRG